MPPYIIEKKDLAHLTRAICECVAEEGKCHEPV